MSDANRHMGYSEQEMLEAAEIERERRDLAAYDDCTCLGCNGSGRIQDGNLWEVDYIVCPYCDGTGEDC